jgi:hypothetical protein
MEKEDILCEREEEYEAGKRWEHPISTIMGECKAKHQQTELQVRRRDNKGENGITRPHAGEEFRKQQRKR